MLAEPSDIGTEPNPALAAEQELQSFSYIVSHDLAASLRHLTIFSKMLLEERGEAASEKERSLGERIREAGAICQAMLDELLGYSRMQRWPLLVVRQDAMPIVNFVLLRCAARAKAAGAEISVEPLGEVHADSELLTRAFAAVIDNALKFTRADVPARIVIRPAHDEAFWRARISDNGVGVEPAMREPAFQMFRRLHGGNAYPGMGAGLAIVRRIARRHGGEAKFVDCDEGACVELSFPRAPRSAPRDARGG